MSILARMALKNIASTSLLVGDTLADRPTDPGQSVPFWNLATDALSLWDGTAWQNGSSQQGFDVTNYGAIGDGNIANAATNRAAIQAAVDAIPASGGVLYFPAGHFYINDAIVLKSYVHVIGAGPNATRIQQTSTTANAFEATDTNYVNIEGLMLIGPVTGSGNGIRFIYSAATTNYVTIRDVEVRLFGADGIRLDSVIVSLFSKVISNNNLGHGFNVLDGTSCSFVACYAITAGQAGFNLNSVNYCTLIGCVSDLCGIGFLLDSSSSISLLSCATASCINVDPTYNAIGFKLNASLGCSLISCRSNDNTNIAVYLTGNSTPTNIVNFREVAPNVSAVNSIVTDTGSSRTCLMWPVLETATSFAPRSVSFPGTSVFVRKAVTSSRNNTTTLATDTELFCFADKNATYHLEARIVYAALAAVDVKVAFTGPAGATLEWTTNALDSAAAASSGSIEEKSSVIGDGGVLVLGGVGAATHLTAKIDGILRVGATEGNVSFRWAQNTIDAGSDAVVYLDSIMRITRIE